MDGRLAPSRALEAPSGLPQPAPAITRIVWGPTAAPTGVQAVTHPAEHTPAAREATRVPRAVVMPPAARLLATRVPKLEQPPVVVHRAARALSMPVWTRPRTMGPCRLTPEKES